MSRSDEIFHRTYRYPFQAIPQAQVTWRYRDTYINNGSTLLNDVDLRHYYHVEKDIASGTMHKQLSLNSRFMNELVMN